MANEVLLKVGTQFSFADHSGDHAPTGNNIIEIGTPTDVQFAVSGTIDNASRQSAKATLGATTRAAQYSCDAALEFFGAPTVGGTVSMYWSCSGQSSAAVGNPGRASGSDAAYTGDGGGTEEESVPQMQEIGSFICTDLIGVQIAHVGIFTPAHAYGSLVIINASGATIAATDDIECTVTLTPIVDEVQ